MLQAYRQKARVDGFRKGKAPLSVIRARYSKEMEQELRDRLISNSFVQAARDKGLQPLGDPALEDVTHEEGQPFSFKTTFEVLPRIELQDYREIEVTRTIAEVTDEEIDRVLEDARKSRVQLIVEPDREAAEGDVVIADVEGSPPEGEPFKRERMPIEVGAQNNLPAFNEHLRGVRAGAKVEFSVNYPADYQAKNLAGKSVEYRLEVHEVKRPELPELDDDFAKDLGEFENLAALRAKIAKDLAARNRHQADMATRQSVVDKVLIQNPVVLPEILVESEVRRRLQDIVRNMMVDGMDPEKVQVDWAELRKKQLEPARKAVHARLILDAVAIAEKVTVDDADVDRRIDEDAKRMGESAGKLRENLKKHSGRETLQAQMVREKSLDYLTSVANILVSGEHKK